MLNFRLLRGYMKCKERGIVRTGRVAEDQQGPSIAAGEPQVLWKLQAHCLEDKNREGKRMAGCGSNHACLAFGVLDVQVPSSREVIYHGRS